MYRARDTRLDRDVAIKLLPALFTADPDRLARFEREARVLASLNHPHIGAIHGIEEVDPPPGSGQTAIRALILELVEGETLADRLNRGPLPVREALTVARQIADALDAAHEKAIVHRDIKPANIAITPAGHVKVLDFGLAKIESSGTSASDRSQSPTLTGGGTREGLVIGTVAYMSPEQARGQPVDKRADIWAFGCVLYEMLTRRPPFGGPTISDTMAGVLEHEPDWNALPATVPVAIARLLQRCLDKDPRRRLHDVADARLEIDDALASREPAGKVQSPRAKTRLGWMLATAALGVALATAVVLLVLRVPEQAPEIRLDVTTPGTPDPASFAISPDGRSLVYALVYASEAADGPARLWLRSLDAVTAQPLVGTEDAKYPFWSPDGKSLAFFSAGARLKRIDVGGGAPQTLADVAPGVGGAWGPGGVILFAPTVASSIYRVSAAGGAPVEVTKPAASGQSSHTFPRFLPDGRRFLFYVLGSEAVRGIYIGSLDSEETTRVTTADAAGAYVAPGWLMFVRQGTLFAQRFDPASAKLDGEPAAIAQSIELVTTTPGAAAFAVSPTGVVAYRATRPSPRQLTWFDRSGKTLGSLGPIDNDNLSDPVLAPDGQRAAVTRTREDNVDIWVLDSSRATRVTFERGEDQFARWSPDGTRVGYSSTRAGTRDLYQKAADGTGAEQLILASPLRKALNDWSPDGRFVLFHQTDSNNGPSLWLASLGEGTKPSAFLDTSFVEVWGEFSPDGRLVAYQSNESGRFEVSVKAFPGPGGQWPVSTSGGIYPRWAPDGGELYFVDSIGQIMASSVVSKNTVTGTTLDVGAPNALFQPRMVGRGTNLVGRRQQYDVAPDGRFLINVDTQEPGTPPITVILNWKAPTF